MDSIGNIINRINLILGRSLMLLALVVVAVVDGLEGKGQRTECRGENQGSLKQLQQAEVEKLNLEMACYDGMGTILY